MWNYPGYPPIYPQCQGCPVHIVQGDKKSKRPWRKKGIKDLSFDEAVEMRDKLNEFLKKEKEKEKKPEHKPKGFLNLSFSQETVLMMILQVPVIYVVVMFMKSSGVLH